MRKYESNKARKILIASLAIPIAVSALPGEMVSANTSTPTLNVYELNGSPKLEWSTQILQENIIENVGINHSSLNTKMSPHVKEEDNNVFIQSLNNENILKVTKTTDGLGNNVWFPGIKQNYSTIYSNNKVYFPIGTKLSMSMKVKSKNKSTISPVVEGTYLDIPKPIAKITQPIKKGQNYFYTDEPYNVGNLAHIVLNKDFKNQVSSMVANVDYETGKVTLNGSFLDNFEAGEFARQYNLYNEAFNYRTFENNDEWTDVSFNLELSNDNYDFLNKGFYFILQTTVEEELLMKDIVFAHATEVEVYRDGQSVYKGYLSDFHDRTVRDNVKPNKISTVNGSITDNFDVNFKIEKPMDNGAKVNYQMQSIAKNGTRSSLSLPQEIEVKTDVVKYKYSISNQLNNTPTNEINTISNISVPLKSVNLENDYLHIQAIDANGNVSDVQSFKLSELIDMKDLYNKIKELESSNNYEDFIDFIDEIENLYGDNLPQDLKEMIDNLGKHHGVNTSFLLLEEGDFRLSTMDIDSFGHTKLTAKKQTLTTAFKGDFGVIDARGTQEGWNLSVSATPFTVETFGGFIGLPHQLPVGSLALNSVTNVEQIGQVHNSQLPNIVLNELTVIDGSNSTVSLLNADRNKGMGEFKFSFGTDALALTVDAVTAKIDNVNYPDQSTPYVSTITWDLISGPLL